jgi:hypothetical protein
MDAVHRLDGSGSPYGGLRYSRSYRESGPVNEGFGPSTKGQLPESLGVRMRAGLNASSWFLPKFPSG